MTNKFIIDSYNLCVVDIWSLLDTCYDDIYQCLDFYNVQVKTRITSDVKNIYLHYIIYNICKFLTKQESGIKVVFYYDPDFTTSSLHTHVTHEFLQKIIKKIVTILPVKIYTIKNVNFQSYKKIIQNDSNGASREHILKLINFTNNCDFSSFTFKKTLSFIKRHNLYLLDKQLLTDLKAKQLLLV